MLERRLLQLVLAMLSLSPLGFGAFGIVYGPGWLKGVGEVPADLDSQFRYLSGIFFGLGLALVGCIPRIEAATTRFRWIAGLVIVGGLARLAGALTHAVPSTGHLIGIAVELVLTPLLVLWQWRIARAARRTDDAARAG